MPVPQELNSWVEEMRKAGLSPETLQALEKDFDRKEVADGFKRTVLAVADYSRQTQELATQRTDVETYLKQLQQWKADKELDLRKNTQETLQYKQQYQQTKEALDRITNAQEDLVRQGVLDPSQLPAPTVVAPTRQDGNGNGHDPKFLTLEDLKTFKENSDKEYLGVLALSTAIQREHFQLFGEVPDMERLLNDSARSGKTLREVWDSAYKVTDKKHELSEAAFKKRVDEEVAQKLSTSRSEEAIRGNTFREGDTGSPVLTALGRANKAAADAVGTSASPLAPIFRTAHPEVSSPGVEKAIEAWRTDRFRSKQ